MISGGLLLRIHKDLNCRVGVCLVFSGTVVREHRTKLRERTASVHRILLDVWTAVRVCVGSVYMLVEHRYLFSNGWNLCQSLLDVQFKATEVPT